MEFLERVRWTNESPAIYVNIYYEYLRDGANMKYRVKLVVEPVSGQRYFGYPIYAKLYSEGGERDSATLKAQSPSQWSSNIEWTSSWWTVNNKTTGTSSLDVNIYSGNGSSRNATYSYSLYVAPAYTSVTSLTVASKTETSITLNWRTADVCSQIRYGTSSSNYTTDNVNSNNGTITINNLTAGTSNTLYFMPYRKDSGLWGDGNANVWKTITESTYNYPYVSVSPDFNIESPVNLTVYNPLGRTCTIDIYGIDDSLIKTITTSTTSTGDILDDNTSITNLYNSIPSVAYGGYYTTTTYGQSEITVGGGRYTALAELSGPLFNDSDFVAIDTNQTTLDLTDNNKYCVIGYSSITGIVYEAHKAVARKGATMSHYRLVIGNDFVEFPYSANLEMSGTIDNVSSGEYTLYAIDSRGNATPARQTAESILNYTVIQKGNVSIERQNNVGEQVSLNFNGTYWGSSFGLVSNSITDVKYKYKKTTDADWPSTWNGTTTITPTVSGNNYSFTGNIKGDLTTGFDAGYSYNLQIQVSDELSSTLFTVTLGSGTPNMAFVEGGVSLLGKYDETDAVNKVQINGNTNVVGQLSVNGRPVGAIPQQDTAPSNPEEDDLWIDTDDVGFQLQVDSAVSTTSTNPIENQAITNYVSNVKLKTAPSMTDSGWMKICNIKFNHHNQGEFVYLKIFIGDGNNGETYQNAFIDFTGQLGWSGSYNGRMGCNADLHPQSTSFNTSNVFMKVIANSNIDYDIWLKTTQYYNKPSFLAYGSNQATIIPSFDKQSNEPSGTACNLYMTTY